MKKIGVVNSVLVGKSVPYAKGSQSAINKKPKSERQVTSRMGFINDEQGDLRVHGGIEKAIHIYPSEHYVEWQKELVGNTALQMIGAFGENISSSGLNENTICLNDKIKIGSTLLEVSQGRMPCWKLNVKFQQHDMALRLQETLRTGWYFRVLEEGDIGCGDEIFLCERPYPEWPLSKIMKLIFEGCLDEQKLTHLLDLPLVKSWRKLVIKRIECRSLEDWSSRLDG
ncbi:MOSC domain-containing protein [Aliivibrio fischeri]|uniref:MOSC domain-containing protein n=1 Tax=Aliivibrio fischeri TaxID=668 RepID=UPI00373601A2